MRRPAGPHIAGFSELLKDRRIFIFSASVVLFHFANAAMLPLVGQKLTDGRSAGAAGYMSACIIAAQLVMVPVAIISSRLAESWGRRAVFLIGFAVLPIRGMLYTLTANPYCARRDPTARRDRRGDLRRGRRAGDRRPDARNGPIQLDAGGTRDGDSESGRRSAT